MVPLETIQEGRRGVAYLFVFMLAIGQIVIPQSLLARQTDQTNQSTIQPTVQLATETEMANRAVIPPIGLDPQTLIFYNAQEIASIAASQSSLSRLLCQQSKRLENTRSGLGANRATTDLAADFLAMQASWQAQQSARQAMQIHFGLLAIESAHPILQESLEYLQQAEAAQNFAIEQGIPIADPTWLLTTRLQVQDQQASQRQTAAKLRAKLALLIPQDIACHYVPTLPLPDYGHLDLCSEIEQAMQRRCDLASVRMVSVRMTPADLDWIRGAIQRPMSPALFLLQTPEKWLARFRFGAQRDFECKKQEVQAASKMLDRLASAEIESRWHELHGSRERLEIAEQLVAVRAERRGQLARMSELGRPMPIEAIEADLEWFAERGKWVERGNEWHQAVTNWLGDTGQLPIR